MRAANSSPTSADAGSEALSAVGLFLIVSSIVAVTVCLATFGTGSAAVGAIMGAVAIATFLGSMACFVLDGRRAQ